MSFAHSDDVVLALDWNLNGIIDNGAELFGDQRGHANGFAALAQLDSNNDRRVDKNDTQFAHLKLLQILQDGRQQLRSLSDAGIVSLSLQFQSAEQFSSGGDRISATADVLFADGRRTKMGELWYQYR